MLETIQHKGNIYPRFQAEGNAARFAIPFAQQFCQGVGYDIGYGYEDWKLPGSIGIDSKDGVYDANDLPPGKVDYIFSSHCLEHIPDWVGTLEYWRSKVKVGGTIYLYLPDIAQSYWRPWSNRKHLHSFSPEIFVRYCQDNEFPLWFVSAPDLNSSFSVVIQNI